MKYKKYVFVLLLVIFIGLSRVEAEDDSHFDANSELNCYYVSNELAARVVVSYNKKGLVKKMTTYLDRRSINTINSYKKQPIENLKGDKTIYMELTVGSNLISQEKYIVPQYYGNSCPQYVIFYDNGDTFSAFHTYAVNYENDAIAMKDTYKRLPTPNSLHVYYAPNKPYMTKEQYWKEYMNVFAYDDVVLEGEKICNLDDSNCTLSKVCGDLLGEEDDPNSVRHFLNQILGYVRIIVPILIVLLGSFDLGRAVVAGKEDEMKKAQKTFFKRIVAGVIVFFVPVIVNIVMQLANMVWDYTTCSL